MITFYSNLLQSASLTCIGSIPVNSHLCHLRRHEDDPPPSSLRTVCLHAGYHCSGRVYGPEDIHTQHTLEGAGVESIEFTGDRSAYVCVCVRKRQKERERETDRERERDTETHRERERERESKEMIE